MLSSATLFSSIKKIKYEMIENTAGYDIHYVIPEGEEKQAQALQDEVKQFIKEYQKDHANIFLTGDSFFHRPVGPWPKKMWELQISPVDKPKQHEGGPTILPDSKAFDVERNFALHKFMLTVAVFTEKRINELKLTGSLLIHANIYPDDSDMQYEYDLHYKHSWLVCGAPIEFKNIWKEYIEIEKIVKQFITEKHGDWKNSPEQQNEVITILQKALVKDPAHGGAQEIARKAKNVMNGQTDLMVLQGKLKSKSLDLI